MCCSCSGRIAARRAGSKLGGTAAASVMATSAVSCPTSSATDAAGGDCGASSQNIASTSVPMTIILTSLSTWSSGSIDDGSAGDSGISTSDMYRAVSAIRSRSSWAAFSKLALPRSGISRSEGISIAVSAREGVRQTGCLFIMIRLLTYRIGPV